MSAAGVILLAIAPLVSVRYERAPVQVTMPHREDRPGISIVELHPTFAAVVRGVDFSKEIPPEDLDQVRKAITKVSHRSRAPDRKLVSKALSQYGVVKFPKTQLDDAGHVAFAGKFGELDDGKPRG